MTHRPKTPAANLPTNTGVVGWAFWHPRSGWAVAGNGLWKTAKLQWQKMKKGHLHRLSINKKRMKRPSQLDLTNSNKRKQKAQTNSRIWRLPKWPLRCFMQPARHVPWVFSQDVWDWLFSIKEVTTHCFGRSGKFFIFFTESMTWKLEYRSTYTKYIKMLGFTMLHSCSTKLTGLRPAGLAPNRLTKSITFVILAHCHQKNAKTRKLLQLKVRIGSFFRPEKSQEDAIVTLVSVHRKSEIHSKFIQVPPKKKSFPPTFSKIYKEYLLIK